MPPFKAANCEVAGKPVYAGLVMVPVLVRFVLPGIAPYQICFPQTAS
jgi:hypothetical protein